MNQSNPKKATKRFIPWWLLSLCGLSVFSVQAEDAKAPQLTSLTLCADRLLMEIARPEQIAALSSFSTKNYAMLQINRDKPTVRDQLSDLIPYAHTTILLNEHFYPRLSQRLKELDFRTVHMDDNPKNALALFALIRQMGELSGNPQRAQALIANLQAIETNLAKRLEASPQKTAMVLADSGVINTEMPQYQQLFKLLKLTPSTKKMGVNFSPEQLLRANPEILITQSADNHYSDGARWFKKTLLSAWQTGKQGRAMAHADSKYFFCFDHGIWLGAEKLAEQLK